MTDINRSPIPYRAVTIVLTLIFAVLYYFEPVFCDDMQYLSAGQAYLADPTFANWCDAAVTNFTERFNYDNGRIPNLVMTPVLITIPDAIICAGLGICVGLMIYFAAKIAGCWRRSALAFGVLVFLFTFWLPWHNLMLTKAFAFNYVIPSVLTLGCACAIICRTELPAYAIVLMALLASLWHESCIFALAGGIIGLVIAFPAFRNRTTLIWGLGLLAGLAYYLAVPATYYRSAVTDADGVWFSGFTNLRNGLISSLPFLMLIAVTIAGLAIKRLRRFFYTPTLAFIIGMALSSFFLFRIFFLIGLRTSWMMVLASSIGWSYIAGMIPRRSLFSLAGGAMILLSVAHLIACVPWTKRFGDDWAKIKEVADAHPAGPAQYLEYTLPTEYPVYVLDKMSAYYGLTIELPYSQVIPARLAEFNPADAVAIGTDCEAYLYKDMIVVGADTPENVGLNLYLSGKPYAVDATTAEFEAGGRRYRYLNLLCATWLIKLHGPVTGVGEIDAGVSQAG